MRKTKRRTASVLIVGLLMTLLTGCAGTTASQTGITVISREDGSGTRSAFTDLFNIISENEAGDKVDSTMPRAEVTNNTAVMMTSISDDGNAIGYVSMGSLNEMVKPLLIDGVEATAENIKQGKYTIARPFSIATREDLNPATVDFIAFIMSEEGQKVVEAKGYISIKTDYAYHNSYKEGKVTVAGSSSVSPVMEALKEAYIKLNPNVQIEIQQSDSTTGIKTVQDGICEIGMSSRNLKDGELALGLSETVIAQDGIAVIVSPLNELSGLSSDQVRAIFMGNVTEWSAVSSPGHAYLEV